MDYGLFYYDSLLQKSSINQIYSSTSISGTLPYSREYSSSLWSWRKEVVYVYDILPPVDVPSFSGTSLGLYDRDTRVWRSEIFTLLFKDSKLSKSDTVKQYVNLVLFCQIKVWIKYLHWFKSVMNSPLLIRNGRSFFFNSFSHTCTQCGGVIQYS